MNRKERGGKPGATTLADVARASGYSPMTVSRAINGEGKIRASTREAVLKVAAELNYSPNLAARSLASAGHIRIGLLYSNPSPAYLSRFLLGTLEQARASNVQLVVENCGPGRANEEAALTAILAMQIDGLILSPPLCDRDYILDMLEAAALPCAAVANWVPDKALSVVRIDDRAAAAEMTRFLIAKGHRRIGFISGSDNQKASAQRIAGYRDAMTSAGYAAEPKLIEAGDFTYRSGLNAAKNLLSLPEPPSAIFASNDDMAAAVVAIAHSMGIDVPARLSVCGFDNTDFAQSIWPELTTVDQPVAEMSRAAMKMLVEQIRKWRSGVRQHAGEKFAAPLEQILLDYQLIPRGTHAVNESVKNRK